MRWLVLTGYMGAGKSTAGAALAQRLDRTYVDTDLVIQERAELDIPRIFATKGELWFRRTEERVIRELVGGTPAGVLSIGGGAVESARTRELLHRVARVAWLRVPPEELWERVHATDRPLATDRDRFLRRYDKRVPAYTEVAHTVIEATMGEDAVVDALMAWAAAEGDA